MTGGRRRRSCRGTDDVTHRTADEFREHCSHKMGAQLGAVYYRLYNECSWLHFKWAEYVEMFGVNEARIDLLNTAAPSFFRVLDDVLWRDVLLHLTRLTEPPSAKRGRRETLTLYQLPRLVDPSIRTRVKALVAEARARSEFARDWRNRTIAHIDLELALKGPSAKPLAPASRAKVKDALRTISDALNAVDSHYCGAEVLYEQSRGDGALQMMYRLRDGIEADTERRDRIKARQASVEEITAWRRPLP